MDTSHFIRDEKKALRLVRQSSALLNLRANLKTNFKDFASSTNLVSDEIDDLVSIVLKKIEQDALKENMGIEDQKARRASYFWTCMVCIPIIFIHAVATRMQFVYGGLYGRDGLNLGNSRAILAVGFTSLGRATAPQLVPHFLNQPYIFMFLNFTTLLGCSGMFLITVIG